MFGLDASVTAILWPADYYCRARNVFVILAAGYLGKKLLERILPSKNNRLRSRNFIAQPGVLVLHQFERGKYCPNLSPFALKLESFLRLAKIPYVVDITVPFGPKGKCPWVNFEDGEIVGDSQFIIDKIIDRELAKGEAARLPIGDGALSGKERGALQGMRALVEEQLFHSVVYWRYYLNGCRVFLTTQRFSSFMNLFFPLIMRRSVKKKAVNQGIAAHSPQEVHKLAKNTCRALDDYLGDSEYFCGPQPGSEDCSIFGGLAQIMWNAPGTEYEAIMTEDFPRLAAYCIRMKEKVFPDWQELTSNRSNVHGLVNKILK